MLLSFCLQTKIGEKCETCLVSEEIEIHMDVLSQLSISGHQLLSVEFIDEEGTSMNLPLEAFDGQPISQYMQALQTEYQQILNH